MLKWNRISLVTLQGEVSDNSCTSFVLGMSKGLSSNVSSNSFSKLIHDKICIIITVISHQIYIKIHTFKKKSLYNKVRSNEAWILVLQYLFYLIIEKKIVTELLLRSLQLTVGYDIRIDDLLFIYKKNQIIFGSAFYNFEIWNLEDKLGAIMIYI